MDKLFFVVLGYLALIFGVSSEMMVVKGFNMKKYILVISFTNVPQVSTQFCCCIIHKHTPKGQSDVALFSAFAFCFIQLCFGAKRFIFSSVTEAAINRNNCPKSLRKSFHINNYHSLWQQIYFTFSWSLPSFAAVCLLKRILPFSPLVP